MPNYAERITEEANALAGAVRLANATTGAEDTGIVDAVATLIAGYGIGGGSSMELINELTLTEAANSIRIDKDSDGNAFTLSRAVLFIFLPAANDGAEHNFYFQTTTYPYIAFGGISGGKTTIIIEAEKNGFIRATRYQYGREFNLQRICPTSATGNAAKMPGDITVVRTANFESNVWPAGTAFKLVGVRS